MSVDNAEQTPDVAGQAPDVAGLAPDVAGQAPDGDGTLFRYSEDRRSLRAPPCVASLPKLRGSGIFDHVL